eukprot:1594279-Karenia_brevis.AAC.1
MSRVPAWAWPCVQDIVDANSDTVCTVRNYEMHAVAFYNETVCCKEEEHIRVIGANFGSQNAFLDV